MNKSSDTPKPAATWLGLGQAAKHLGVHPTTLRRWVDSGAIPVMLTPGGHRRFALSELRRSSEERSQLRLTAGLEKIWADQAIQQTRQEIVAHRDDYWLAAFGETDRQQKRELGRRLMGVMLQYAALHEGGESLLDEARLIGRAHAENSLGLGWSLVETLQVMLFFRDTLVEVVVHMPAAARVQPEVNLRLLRRIHSLLNAVQLAIVDAYEQAKR